MIETTSGLVIGRPIVESGRQLYNGLRNHLLPLAQLADIDGSVVDDVLQDREEMYATLISDFEIRQIYKKLGREITPEGMRQLEEFVLSSLPETHEEYVMVSLRPVEILTRKKRTAQRLVAPLSKKIVTERICAKAAMVQFLQPDFNADEVFHGNRRITRVTVASGAAADEIVMIDETRAFINNPDRSRNILPARLKLGQVAMLQTAKQS